VEEFTGKLPILPVTTFILGADSALGHHFLHKTCGGREVGNTSEQEWVIRGDTALVFLTKTFSVSALAMAYMRNMHGLPFGRSLLQYRPLIRFLLRAITFSHSQMGRCIGKTKPQPYLL
jgi:hypothetical protein